MGPPSEIGRGTTSPVWRGKGIDKVPKERYFGMAVQVRSRQARQERATKP